MKIAILGCGLIGQKRAKSLAGGPDAVVAVADPNLPRAEALAKSIPACAAYADAPSAIRHAGVDAVIICTSHDQLAGLTLAALNAGKHVLVEKPAARSAAELDPVIAAAEANRLVVRVGFNHRYHPALLKARELVDAGALGGLYYIRGRYGHGGRPGYDKEWRAVKSIAGGGELTDQGVHLIDLARWFLGDFPSVTGFAPTYFWNMEVEDNGFMLLRTPANQVAFLHATWTEWKNTFSFEITGKLGKIEITGLGGSYGPERLAFYKMLFPQMGPPETTIWEYPMGDRSWEIEMNLFRDDVAARRQAGPGPRDARAALLIVEKIYQESKR